MKQTLLSLLMLLLPMTASAYDVEIDGIYYDVITKAKVAEVTFGENKYTGDVLIPSTIEYKGVTCDVKSIASGAFTECEGLTSLVLSEGLETIKSGALQVVRNLKSVTIPKSLKTIGEWNFTYADEIAVHISDLESWCHMSFSSNPISRNGHLYMSGKEVTELILYSSLETINDMAFSGCKSIQSVIIEDGIKMLGNCLFDGCQNLSTISFPNNSLTIGSSAFGHCPEITSIEFKQSIEVGEYVFGECPKLKSVKLPSDFSHIGIGMFAFCTCLNDLSFIENVKRIEGDAFDGCSGLTEIVLPSNLSYIGGSAFAGCTELVSISLSSNIQTIESGAFSYCKNLMDVYCYSQCPPQTAESAFEGSYIEFATLHVPASALNAYSNTAPWSNFKNIVAIGEQEQLYTLTYMVDGIKYVESNVREGEKITPKPAPAKNGYTFSGWSEIPETMPAHDVTITGSFTVNKYNLIYKVDDADYKTYEVEYGATITPEPAPTKIGYNFSGWREIPATMPDHDVTVSGIFIPKTYLPGDANGDGQITVTDIGVIVDIILGKTPANARKQKVVEPE